MRIAAFALALVVGIMPSVAANAGPVLGFSAPSEAVLFEPLVFTSTSHDPDGTIASTTWEFSDSGRTKSGAVVTHAFGWPGLHTVTLRVRDDAGAEASVDIPVLVHATLMQGRAYALRGGDATLADTGDVATAQHTDHGAAAGEWRHGQLRVAGLDATLRTLQDRAVARADVGYVYVPVPIGYILITGIEAESIVGCDHPTIVNSKFTQVRLNDGALVPPGSVPPNTRVQVPGAGTLDLNVQESMGDRISVAAVRFTALDGQVLEAAHAEAGVSYCPFA